MNESKYTTGTCRFCGQLINVDDIFDTQEQADESAVELCECPGSKTERTTKEQIAGAKERVNQLFGLNAVDFGFEPVKEREPVVLLENIVELVARRCVSAAGIIIRGGCRAKVNISAKGKIKVERSETNSYQLEE